MNNSKELKRELEISKEYNNLLDSAIKSIVNLRDASKSEICYNELTKLLKTLDDKCRI
jgi:hypothetical protein